VTGVALAPVYEDYLMMNEKIKALSQEARKLSPAERAELIDELITSLDRPDPAIVDAGSPGSACRL
jgi:hypothetical protein